MNQVAEEVSKTILAQSFKWLDELKVTQTPIPFGKGQRFKSFIPEKTPDQILETTDSPYLWGYAEVMREYIDLLEAMPKMAFVDKATKVSKR